MEDLSKELSCPVCLDLFTPPIIELDCGHNFCDICIEQTIRAKYNSDLQFPCPMCREEMFVNGDSEKRNWFAENVLEKFKELENQELPKTQQCPEHHEELTLMCIEEDSAICNSCKLFGDHSTHTVAKISDVYKLRKEGYIQLMNSLEDKSKAKTVQDLNKQKEDLRSTTQDTVALLVKLGDKLIEEIQVKVATMARKVHSEASVRYKSLQDGKEELNDPRKLHAEMKKHLESNKCPVEFLKQERRLHDEAVKILVPKDLSQCSGYISLGRHVEELLSAIDVKKLGTANSNGILSRISQDLEAWKSVRTNFDSAAYQSLDAMLTKTATLMAAESLDRGEVWLGWKNRKTFSSDKNL